MFTFSNINLIIKSYLSIQWPKTQFLWFMLGLVGIYKRN